MEDIYVSEDPPVNFVLAKGALDHHWFAGRHLLAQPEGYHCQSKHMERWDFGYSWRQTVKQKKNTPSTFKKIQVQRVEEKDGHEEKICNMLSGGVAHRDTTTPGHRDISPWGPRICSVWAPVIRWQKALTEVLGWVQN